MSLYEYHNHPYVRSLSLIVPTWVDCEPIITASFGVSSREEGIFHFSVVCQYRCDET